MAQYVMNRNVTVSSVFGHTLAFEKDVPLHVPQLCVTEVQAVGGIPYGGETHAQADRAEQVKAATAKAKSKKSGKTASGAPTVASVEAEAGFDISAAERDAALAELDEGD